MSKNAGTDVPPISVSERVPLFSLTYTATGSTALKRILFADEPVAV